MPVLRPFRGLRFDVSAAGDPRQLIAPPYDVIAADEQRRLLDRSPYNAVRLELPAVEPGDDADAKYRRAAAEIVAWRTARVLRKDRRPGIYVYAQTYSAPGGERRTQRAFFARLKLEPFGERGGVRPHEATLSGPKEDRLRLLRATGTNTSAVMALYRSRRASAPLLEDLTRPAPDVDVCDEQGVQHRLWYLAADGDGSGGTVQQLLAVAGERPVVIADGHHRYETALRYRDERARACEADPPFDYVMSALYDVETEPLTILPTHRLLRSGPVGNELFERAARFFALERLPSPEALIRGMSGRGEGMRFGVYSAGVAGILQPRPEGLAPLLEKTLPPPLRNVDSAVLAASFVEILGLPSARQAGELLQYTKDAHDAVRAVDAGEASSAFLLDPTPPDVVARVAEAGEVMPQKSTYFYPKVITGLVFNPLED